MYTFILIFLLVNIFIHSNCCYCDIIYYKKMINLLRKKIFPFFSKYMYVDCVILRPNLCSPKSVCINLNSNQIRSFHDISWKQKHNEVGICKTISTLSFKKYIKQTICIQIKIKHKILNYYKKYIA